MTKEEFKEEQKIYEWFWSDENKARTLDRGYEIKPFGSMPIEEVYDILKKRYVDCLPYTRCSEKYKANRVTAICQAFIRIAELQQEYNYPRQSTQEKFEEGLKHYQQYQEMFKKYNVPWVRNKMLTAVRLYFEELKSVDEIAKEIHTRSVDEVRDLINEFEIIVLTRTCLNGAMNKINRRKIKEYDETMSMINNMTLKDAGYPAKIINILQAKKFSKVNIEQGVDPMLYRCGLQSLAVELDDVKVYYSDLLEYSEVELLKIHEFGPSSLRFIKKDLEIIGISLRNSGGSKK